MVAAVRTLTAPKIVTDLIKWEAEPAYSREYGVLAANNPVVIGTALGKIAFGAVTSAAKSGGNTGNGTLTVDTTSPLLSGATQGVYQVRYTSATAYQVTDPRGVVLGTGANGTAFANRIKFNTAAGGTAFAAGDGFDVTVAKGSGKIVALNPLAVDGSAVCVGFSGMLRDPGNTDYSSGFWYIARAALLADAGIVWPDGFTTAQIAQAMAEVAPVGLIARQAI